jgi:hypothetical protein
VPLTLKAGDIVRYRRGVQRGRRNNRGPVLMIVGDNAPEGMTDPVRALAALSDYQAADHLGTITVDESQVEILDVASLLALPESKDSLTKIKFPVKVVPARIEQGESLVDSIGKIERMFEAVCLCKGRLRLAAHGTTENEALRRLHDMLVAEIQPPAAIAIVV